MDLQKQAANDRLGEIIAIAVKAVSRAKISALRSGQVRISN